MNNPYHDTRKMPRPRWLIALTGGLTASGGVALYGVARDAPLYTQVNPPFGVGFALAYAGGWMLIFAFLTFGLWRRRRWALRWGVPLICAYALANLARFVLFARSDYDTGRIGFQAAFTLTLVALLGGHALRKGWLRRP